MKRYLSFYDIKEKKSLFYDLSNAANVKVKTTKKSIVVEITNEHGDGLMHTHYWENEEIEKVNQLFHAKLDERYTMLILLYITERVRGFVAQNSLKNAIFNADEDRKEWHKYMVYTLDHMKELEDEPEKDKTNE